jgi:hypothetical protein
MLASAPRNRSLSCFNEPHRNAFKADRVRAKAALERIRVQLTSEVTLEPDQVERFGAFMRERITRGETTFRKAYLRSIVDAIEVDDKVIRIHGAKASLEQAVIAGEQIRYYGANATTGTGVLRINNKIR